jgi:hypothetical protein
VSVANTDSVWRRFLDFDPYMNTPLDLLHNMESGVFKTLLEASTLVEWRGAGILLASISGLCVVCVWSVCCDQSAGVQVVSVCGLCVFTLAVCLMAGAG